MDRLDAPTFGTDGRDLQETIKDESAVQADCALEDEECDSQRMAALDRALAAMPKREAAIVLRHLGNGETLAAIGAEMGMSRERARQLEARAMGRIRDAMGVPAGAAHWGRDT